MELMRRPDMADMEKSLNRAGYAHIALSVGSAERLNSLMEKLREAGFGAVSGPGTTGDGYYESRIAAIEGNQIETTE